MQLRGWVVDDLELMEMSTTGFGWSVGVGSGEIRGLWVVAVVWGCYRSYQ